MGIFTVEIIIRLFASAPLYSFFKDGWNVFDFLIVAGGFIIPGGQFIVVLCLFRIFRVLRTISAIPSLQRMIMALIRTIPAMGNIVFLLLIIFYIFGVIGTYFFSHLAPEYFGSLHDSFITLPGGDPGIMGQRRACNIPQSCSAFT